MIKCLFTLSFLFCCFFLVSQTDTIIVYTLKTGKIDTILPVSFNPGNTSGTTPSSIGSLGNKTLLSLTPPVSNVFAGSSFSDIVEAANVFSLADYPVRTATAVRYYRADSFFVSCSGILVAPEFVLTAAHCLYSYPTKSFLSMDSMQLIPSYNNGQETAGIPSSYAKRFYIFKTYYDAKNWDDAALIELEDPIGIQTGWVGIGYSLPYSNYNNQVFHKFSYPARPHPSNPSKVYNGDTMYYNYGYISTISSQFLGINSSSATGIPGQSGSSFVFTDNTDYYSVGVMSFSSNYMHTPINNKVFYQFQNILSAHPMSVKEHTVDKPLHVWPNPCGDLLYITISDMQSPVVSIYDVIGHKVLSTEVNSTNPISVEHLESGIYYLNLESEYRILSRTRFIKH